jgi:uncharacterized protein (DUF849 family)
VHAIEVRGPQVEGETGLIAGIARGRLDLPAQALAVIIGHVRVGVEQGCFAICERGVIQVEWI